MTDGLFDMEPVARFVGEPTEKLSADRRRTQRQRELIDAGLHPVTHRRHVGIEAPEKCGNCRFRQLFGWHNRTYPKCVRDDGRLTHGAATDVRAWWPACTDYEPASSPALQTPGAHHNTTGAP